ncbi:hypothetical protein [Sphingobacterium hungaricum]
MKSLQIILSIASAGILLASCNNPAKDKATTESGHTIEQLSSDTSAAKQTLFLRFVSEQQTDSSIIYTAKSLFKTDTVGLNIEVLKKIAPGISADGSADTTQGFSSGAIRFSSIGAQSDALVASLGELFKLPTTGKMTTATISPLVFSSNNTEVDLSEKKTFSFKLFFPNTKGAEAETFAVVDTYRQAFELSEKDSTFRVQLLSAFEGN